MNKKILLIGIGGASCSGKTALTKHLARILPSALVVHQDDFCPPSEEIPVHPVHKVQDWDDPNTAIDWPRFRTFISRVKAGEEGKYESHDHLNVHHEITLPDGIERECTAQMDKLRDKGDIKFVLVDGFVLYYDPAVVADLDVKALIRVPRDTLKKRREARATYVLQHEEDAAAGGVWNDPPGYFDNIVWPGYVKAHSSLFSGGDVENGEVVAKGVALLEPEDGSEGMGKMVRQVCEMIANVVNNA